MIRTLAIVWGLLFLLGGILGFAPGITNNGMFLGVFLVNTPHGIMHIASGIIFLVASGLGARAARLWFLLFGAFYAALGVYGVWAGDGLICGLISNNLFDGWGHIFLGLVLLLIGVAVPAAGTAVKADIDGKRFGPWALITGASSGIGREFAERIAASGIHIALVARREPLLQEVGAACSQKYNVQHRVIAADLSEEGFMSKLAEATRDLDIGLVISNAGSANPGRFMKKEPGELAMTLRLSALAHAEIALHYGRKLTERGTGGIVFVGAMGSPSGAPFMAHDGGVKAYVESLGLALHEELKRYGVYVTVLAPGPTDTPVLARFGLDPKAMPMKPMRASQAVREGLNALSANRPLIIPGRINRIMRAILPASLTRSVLRTMFEKMPELAKSQSGLGIGQ